MMIGSKFQNIKKSRQSNRDIYLFMKEDAGGGILVHNIQPVLTVEKERERERERERECRLYHCLPRDHISSLYYSCTCQSTTPIAQGQ